MACFDRFRYVIALLILGSTLVAYIGRVNLSVVISFVTKPTNSSENDSDVCPAQNYSSSESESNEIISDKFDFDQTTQGHMLSAFFYSYLCMQIPGGLLSERFGPRLLTSSAIIITGLISMASPLLIQRHLHVYIGFRALMGAAQGMIFPGFYCLISRWIPPSERGTIFGAVLMGPSVGAIIGTSLAGYLCKHLSWQSAFYIPGIMITSFGLLYAILMNDHPKNHFLVSRTELALIHQHNRARLSVGSVNLDLPSPNKKSPPFPWKQVLTCKAVWATAISKFANGLSQSFYGYKAPSYMEKVLGVSVDRAGYYVSAIFASCGLCSLLAGFLADTALRYKLNKTLVRKVFQSIASFGIAICYFTLPSSGCHVALFVVLQVIQAACLGFATGGEAQIPSDLTTDFTATVFAFTNMISMSASISPQVYGLVLDGQPGWERHTWAYIFYFIGAINVAGGLVFVLFASTEPQNWDSNKSATKSSQRKRSLYATEEVTSTHI